MNSTTIITGSMAVAGRELVCNVYGAQRLYTPAPPMEDHGLRPRCPGPGAKRQCWPWVTGNSNRPAHDPQLGVPPHPSRHESALR